MERRRLFTTTEFYENGGTRSQLRTGVRRGKWVRADHDVYADGPDEVSDLDRVRARFIASRATAWGVVAGVLHDVDGAEEHLVDAAPKRRRTPSVDEVIAVTDGVSCTSERQTLLDLAEVVDDIVWEQALEWALRRKAITIGELAELLPKFSASRRRGVGRIRRVLALRPAGAPPTESLLETLMVQLIRLDPTIPLPTRQFRVVREDGVFVARVDLCWPDLGLFIELDGQQHKGQPVYDANRQTRVIEATGWLCGRFTWREVRFTPSYQAKRVARLVEQARRRPVSQVS